MLHPLSTTSRRSGVSFCTLLAALTLTGCDSFTTKQDGAAARAANSSGEGSAGATETSPVGAAKATGEPRKSSVHFDRPEKLAEEVKRLNKACVDAGGGVSGSPDCDRATVLEEALNKSGFCIDYPHDEQLIRCEAVRKP